MRPRKESTVGLEFEELRRYVCFVAMASNHPLLRMNKVSVETLAAPPLAVLCRRVGRFAVIADGVVARVVNAIKQTKIKIQKGNYHAYAEIKSTGTR